MTKRIKVEPKFNSTVVYREEGEDELRRKLEALTIIELKAIIRAYCPDMNMTMYRKREGQEQEVIEYIIYRSEYLSTLGQCFRDLPEKPIGEIIPG